MPALHRVHRPVRKKPLSWLEYVLRRELRRAQTRLSPRRPSIGSHHCYWTSIASVAGGSGRFWCGRSFLFLGTITHQPDPWTDFVGFAGYVTTTEFLISHLVTSIVGAAFGVLALLALFTFLALRVRSRLAAVGLCILQHCSCCRAPGS
jgi:hypothetical protein